jgi:uncharacterized protein YfdQ (DUF2303 family)
VNSKHLASSKDALLAAKGQESAKNKTRAVQFSLKWRIAELPHVIRVLIRIKLTEETLAM